jgi:uncharacterized protein YbbC (DUF1343 family)
MENNTIQKFEDLLKSFTTDYKKFVDKDNVSASIRARKVLQEIRALCKETREEISNTRKKREGSKK